MTPVFTNYRICQDLNKNGVYSVSNVIENILFWILAITCYSFFGFILFIIGCAIYHNL